MVDRILFQAILLDEELCDFLREHFNNGGFISNQIYLTIFRGKKRVISRELMFKQLEMEFEFQKEKAPTVRG
ncbi:hypothetical protein ACQV2X_05435 [Facklamia sp. P12945]|uniref:hypothetical protein n=1 Tax=unclassified Facklamia TaxID=2622293 RepID=UPI003D17A643